MSESGKGFVRALSALSERGVEFVVVCGVGGINFYARTPAEAFPTLDLDAVVAPAVEDLRRVLGLLSELGYSFETGREGFTDIVQAKPDALWLPGPLEAVQRETVARTFSDRSLFSHEARLKESA